MGAYILAIDQGTTSSRAILFDLHGQVVALAQQPFEQHFPADGWVEHDAAEIWQSCLSCVRQVLAKVSFGTDQILSLGITNQRETTILWDRTTGEPVCPAIVWQDRRTAESCRELKAQGHEKLISERTGLLLDPYFCATKLQWMLDHVPNARQRAEHGKLAFGTVDSYLLWQLTGGAVHATDATNASRTMLFDIHRQCWDEDLLRLFNIPRSLLPEVKDSAADYGRTLPELFGGAIDIGALIGDQQAALVGQGCFSPGRAKSTYGTGCFLMLNTGSEALQSNHRLLTTVAYRIDGEVCYALEGSIFIAGAAIQWLRDGLHLIDHSDQSELLAQQTDEDHGVYLVPAFTGLGAPYWDPDARGAMFGLTRDTGIAELVTAGLEAVCYQSCDLLQAMDADGLKPQQLKVDGGMAANDWLLQRLADLTGCEVLRPQVIETTAWGAASLAGVQAGAFASLQTLAEHWRFERCFEPVWNDRQRQQRYSGWLDAVARVRS